MVETENKVIARLSGGLDNQLFQYAAGEVVSRRTGRSLIVDPSGIYFGNRRGQATKRGFDLRQLLPDLRVFDPSDLSGSLKLRFAVTHGKSRAGTLASNIAFLIDSIPVAKRELFRDQDSEQLLQLSRHSRLNPVVHLNGYWADYRFPEAAGETLKSRLRRSINFPKRLHEIRNSMKDSESTIVHVRRGDFFVRLGDYSQRHVKALLFICDGRVRKKY